ncbi:TonB-dependent receptor [Taibaiella soli]|uniref:TonB-dependent receptor n=1 Tax=Taibaiella soli TaxID=1649169 RepID=A0A2W2A8V2_9BACT|nr:TonB-dependent receptor [Taibaiella soli]PZF71745.1 TonB-dependent receptor [Taibaiella soli]
MLKRFGLMAILFFAFTVAAFAQTGTIKGFVYDKSTGEPMIYTNVFLEGTKIGVQTDLNGYFSIRQVPEGTYTIFTTVIGYDTARATITITRDKIETKKLYVSHTDRQLKDVTISAHKTEQITQIKAGSMTITPREMKLLPSAGGEPDIAQFLQVTPGVVFTGDQGGQLYIRGGSPSQTGILLDGVTIYNPFHSIGLYSVFETDAIRSVDVMTAGFNAEYGNRTSAILDIRTKDGNRNNLSGKVSVSPIMARAMLEGPLVKPKSQDGGATTFLLSVKHSYLDQTSTALYSGLGEPFKSGLPYSFTDLYGKLTFSGSNGSKLNLFGFDFDDKSKMFYPNTDSSIAAFHWNAVGGGTNFVVSPGNSDALISGKFAYSKYYVDYDEANFRTRNSGIDGFEGAIDFSYFLPGYSLIKYGVEVSGYHTSLDYINSSNVNTTLDRRSTQGALYAVFRKNFNDKLIIEPSLRLMYYSSISKISPEPRLGLKYNVSKNVRLKAAGGIYTQNIISTKNDRDIVNFFTGFLLSPDQEIKTPDGDVLKSNLERAYHVLGGVEVDINRVELNLEPWMKDFTTLIELNRNKNTPEDPDFAGANGKAYGVDLSAKYSYKRIYLWGVVSYQHIQYQSVDDHGQIQNYPPPFDRRININLLGAYTAGKKKNWDLSIRYNIGSPFPFTQTQGFFENGNPTIGGIGTNTNTQNGPIGILYANDINGGRLSWYHRMDISAKRRFYLNKRSNLETTFAITNVYDRNNIFYVNRLDNTRIYQLPIFPSINVTWNF